MIRTLLKDKKLETVKTFRNRFQSARLLKYTPEKRCLFVVESNAQDHFVKIYPKKFLRDNRGEKIHNIGQKLWELSENRSVDFRVPKAIAWDSETHSLWQQKMEGDPAIVFLLGDAKPHLASRIGKKIAQITNLDIEPPRNFDRTEQMEDTWEFTQKLTGKFPKLLDEVSQILKAFSEAHHLLPFNQMTPTHGDMHIDQWLFDGVKLGLLDFEDFSLAEPERDLAFFTVHLEAEYGKEICVGEVEKELIAGFESLGKKIDRQIYRLYKAHKWIARAAKAKRINAARTLLANARCELEAVNAG